MIIYMIVFPNAKINIGLNVISKREDGFHNIETVFYPIPFFDILEVIKDNENKKSEIVTFNTSGNNLDCPVEKNLVYKAYEIFRSYVKNVPSVKIHLHKIIPLGSGLGAGSSDASFMLKILNEFCNNVLSEDDLLELSSKIGSDCPFFIKNAPSIAYGRGEILEPINLNLSDYYIALIIPELNINTGKAYNSIKIKDKKEKSLKELISLPIEKWRDNIVNDFEDIVFEWYPELKKIKEELYKAGAIYSSLSGSGSTIYGIFKEKPELTNYLKNFFNCVKPLNSELFLK